MLFFFFGWRGGGVGGGEIIFAQCFIDFDKPVWLWKCSVSGSDCSSA